MALINDFLQIHRKAQRAWISATRRGGGNPKCPRNCNHMQPLRQSAQPTDCPFNQADVQPTLQPPCTCYHSRTHMRGQMLNVYHIHHAHVPKVNFKYQLYSFILMKLYRCHTHVHMFEIVQCVFTSVHTLSYHA